MLSDSVYENDGNATLGDVEFPPILDKESIQFLDFDYCNDNTNNEDFLLQSNSSIADSAIIDKYIPFSAATTTTSTKQMPKISKLEKAVDRLRQNRNISAVSKNNDFLSANSYQFNDHSLISFDDYFSSNNDKSAFISSILPYPKASERLFDLDANINEGYISNLNKSQNLSSNQRNNFSPTESNQNLNKTVNKDVQASPNPLNDIISTNATQNHDSVFHANSVCDNYSNISLLSQTIANPNSKSVWKDKVIESILLNSDEENQQQQLDEYAEKVISDLKNASKTIQKMFAEIDQLYHP
uniref:Uncharacterized protein n=1 Tax=Panagrolaimus sp. ES5 TaxID=591445 RepID=A0AC34FZ47_9BILA